MADREFDNLGNKTPEENEQGFPVAAIVCVVIGAYLLVIMIFFLIRGCLMRRGMCLLQCCGKEGDLQCCECCVSCAEGTNCCKSPSVEAWLDSICPARKRLSCVDIIMCECCANQSGGCCGSQEPLCDRFSECCKPHCEDEWGHLNCCCFSISIAGNAPYPPYPGYPPYAGYPPYPVMYPDGHNESIRPGSEAYGMVNYGHTSLDKGQLMPRAGGLRRPLPGISHQLTDQSFSESLPRDVANPDERHLSGAPF